MSVNPLAKKPRVRRLVERAARWALEAVGAPEPEPAYAADPVPAPPRPAESTPAPAAVSRVAPAGRPGLEQDAVTTLLHTRLEDSDIAEIEQRLLSEDEPREIYEQATAPAARRFLHLAYGVWFGIPAVLEKTGLSPDQPPDEIHAMARGPLAAAGGLYEADMVVDVLASAGCRCPGVRAALDFGCSSGRVAAGDACRVPATSWHGCDPNEPAIEWALCNLPGIELLRKRPGASTGIGGRGSGPRVRDLDLVALRARAGAALVRGDAPADPTGRASRLHDARALDRGPRRRPRGCAAPEQSQEIAQALYARGHLVRTPSSGRGATGASSTPAGARRSSRRSGCWRNSARAGALLSLRPAATRQPGRVRAGAGLTGPRPRSDRHRTDREGSTPVAPVAPAVASVH